jgi:uncharacterized protein YecA (UPF0149 family)
MNKDNKDMINQVLKNNESCCSKASCCTPKSPVVYTQPKVGRNDPCPCNSGLKLKRCCG